jgi:hypothetical protein
MKQEQPAELVREEASPIISMMQLALEKGAVEQLDKLMAMHERWEANQARKAFVQAMSDFKKEAIVITRDKENVQYSKGDKKAMYTSIGNLVGTVTPLLSKHGLSAGWNLDQSSGIKVGCAITHALGHSETTWITVPLDTSGAKNPLQQIKSSITYARVVSFEMACGLASVEANLDDDGNGAGAKGKGMDQEEFDRLCGLIENAGSPESLKTTYLAACEDAKELGDRAAIDAFAKIKNARWKELHANR